MKNYTWSETVGGFARLPAGKGAGERMDGIEPRAVPASTGPSLAPIRHVLTAA
jgi:hypothetical protein